MNTATETLLAFWKEPRNIPFKGRLISEESLNDGEPPTTCMCAQGQALHIVGGYSEENLRNLNQEKADKEVAKLLGISVAHSILLRRINDSQDGAPSDVLTNPEKYLGKNYQAVLDFWTLIDSLTEDNWKEVIRRYNAAWDAARGAAFYAASNVASNAASNAAGDAPFDTARYAARYAAFYAAGYATFYAASNAAGYATCELIGNVQNPVFMSLFDNLGT